MPTIHSAIVTKIVTPSDHSGIISFTVTSPTGGETNLTFKRAIYITADTEQLNGLIPLQYAAILQSYYSQVPLTIITLPATPSVLETLTLDNKDVGIH
ncbi:hypothetical protein [Xenorhabdus bovienii]|uniref:hypothetical protein n=1 Tax=Xenorhabdus bovienii TaxID=40576 RepID=UPI0023B2463D|nr:hypothetical protein [Xenorhabdus bovienii]MDE9428552.1 hypothetical protein [Xenorhabdus bovienii]